MHEKKAAAYKNLVADMQEKKQPTTKKLELFAPVLNGEIFCNEINLYTYWQGLGYAEKTPKIKYLLVAQDWGNPFLESNKLFMERIKKINDGDKTTSYFGDDKIYITDKNLIELFKVLGYENIKDKRYDELFFTNFCLGYRIGKQNGGMTKEIMMNYSEEFKRLCEILEPENILCLGKITAECAYKTLTGKNLKISNYNNFLDNPTKFAVKVGETTARFYPLAHCGDYGTMNRNKEYKNGKFVCVPDSKDLGKQKKDWAKVAKDNI